MTKDEYIQLAGDDLAEFEEIAALGGMTGQEMVEFYTDYLVRKFKEKDRNLGTPCNAVVTQVIGNVIQVNFSARAAASWKGRKAYQKPENQGSSANLTRIMPATVPLASPNTVIPYSSC